MTLALFVLAAVCAVNAPRSISAVPGGGEGWFAVSPQGQPKPGGAEGLAYSKAVLVDAAGRRLAVEGSVVAGVVLVPVALLADPLLDVLDISAPTARIAVGLLLVVSGIVTFGWPPPKPEPALPGRRAALVPVAFPTLLTPGLTLLVMIAAVDLGILVTLLVTAAALATLPADGARDGLGRPDRFPGGCAGASPCSVAACWSSPGSACCSTGSSTSEFGID